MADAGGGPRALANSAGALQVANQGVKLSAAQQALRIPEIIGTLMEGIHQRDERFDYMIYDADGEHEKYCDAVNLLSQCAFVNKLWYSEALRLIWRKSQDLRWNRTLLQLFAKIPADRRQYYANFVETGSMMSVSDQMREEANETFRGILFPKLHTVTILVDPYHNLPRVDCPNLQKLVIDPRREFYPDFWAVTQDDADKIFDDMVNGFRHVPSISFIDECYAYVGAVQGLIDL
ncbi:Phospholipase D1 [Sphaceloma murrayae]|uniref:Phospholipase D1 n=1 Tax=Sphaceloma murrayae TaxID=2082308 RepID=A0A2K1QZ13_9PEZI|nr:Phospholipase D1 [Sphaceloma murrayae]